MNQSGLVDDLIKKQRELGDAKLELDLTVEKRIQEGLADWLNRIGAGPRSRPQQAPSERGLAS